MKPQASRSAARAVGAWSGPACANARWNFLPLLDMGPRCGGKSGRVFLPWLRRPVAELRPGPTNLPPNEVARAIGSTLHGYNSASACGGQGRTTTASNPCSTGAPVQAPVHSGRPRLHIQGGRATPENTCTHTHTHTHARTRNNRRTVKVRKGKRNHRRREFS